MASRALLVQFGFYMHMQHVMGVRHYIVSRPVVFAMSFMLLFSIVIALFKDIPDIQGDSQVQTLASSSPPKQSARLPDPASGLELWQS